MIRLLRLLFCRWRLNLSGVMFEIEYDLTHPFHRG